MIPRPTTAGCRAARPWSDAAPLSPPTVAGFSRQAYGQWWEVETFISVVNRRFGGVVTARLYWQQVKQTLLRGMTYDLYQAVQLGLSVHLQSLRLFKAAA
jgi:hypothetical protein